jgi:hypothetical protein
LSTVNSPGAHPVEVNTNWQSAKIDQLPPCDREQLHVAVTLDALRIGIFPWIWDNRYAELMAT